MDLAQATRKHTSKGLGFFVDRHRIGYHGNGYREDGERIALNLLFGLPLLVGVLTIFDVLLLLFF